MFPARPLGNYVPKMNSCFHSIDETPVTLPVIGALGDYVMPPIISSGVQLAPGFRIPCKVALHIGAFGLQLQEIDRPRFAIECHYSSFQPDAASK